MKRLKTLSDYQDSSQKYESKIGQLILIDRSKFCKRKLNFKFKNIHLYFLKKAIDNITPFCSPLTYEGLINECFTMNSGKLNLIIL